jgi:hypothetical protein
MCTSLEAKRHVCYSKLCHMRIGHWMMYESLSEPWTTCMSLAGRHAFAWTKLCTVLPGLYPGCGMHRSSNKHLACSNGTNLDCCKMMTITGDYDMNIITLATFTSCCLVSPLLPMLCPCCTGDVRIVESHAPCLGHIFTGSGSRGALGPGF